MQPSFGSHGILAGTQRGGLAYLEVQHRQGEPVMTTAPYMNAQAVFYQQYEHVRRDEVVGILLALFLGGFGIHHFYLQRTGWGIFYLCFCWTPLPWVLGFIECFFMAARVREFNAIQAAGISAALGIPVPIPNYARQVNFTVNMPPAAGGPMPTQPGTLTACRNCQKANPAGARFCSSCGAAV